MTEKVKCPVDEHGFGPLESWFIDKYLHHAEETLEDAKNRI